MERRGEEWKDGERGGGDERREDRGGEGWD